VGALPAPRARDLLELIKPGISLSLTYSALIGYLLGSAPSFSAPGLVTALLGVLLGVSGAEAMSAYTDREVDSLMLRTMRRPVPGGRVSPKLALAFGLALSAAAHLLLLMAFGPVPFLFLLLGTLIYVVLYTVVLKRRTPLNIIIGSFAGGMPLLVGSAAAGSLPASSLFAFALIVVWTPVHIWSLSLHYRDDYRRAGVPMLPAVVQEREAARLVGASGLVLAGFSFLALLANFGLLYYIGALLLNVQLVRRVLSLAGRHAGSPLALFRFTNVYLMLALTLMGLDSVLFHGV
jgi:protoheme IX farnesyltransferase